MKNFIVALAICCCAFPAHVIAGPANGPAKLIVTLLTGAAAAGAARNADAANAIFKEKEIIVDKLRAEGIDPANRAIYSAYLQLDKNASAIYWERWVGWPNVVLEVEIGGQGSFLIPRIEMKYQGQPILENLIGEYAAPGTRVVIHVLDDKQFQNAVWNSILKAKINLNVSAGVVANKLLKLNAQADGSFQILDKDMRILQPICMATAEFVVPESRDGRWLAEAVFRDTDNNTVGRLQFAQMWDNPIIEAREAHSNYVFWIVVTGAMGLIFIKFLFSRQTKPQQ